MAEQKSLFNSRPEDILTFVDRCKDPSLSSSERDALTSWCNDIVRFLTPQEIPKFAWESARLSEILPNDASTKLLRHVVNAINNETQEGTALDPGLLRSFVYIIRQRGNPTSDIHKVLGPLFSNMKNRLASTIDQGILEEQYEVTWTLCIVIDAMADVSMSGISHENLYRPLIGLLDGLSQNPELHLAQSASYAAQALRGIEDNDTIGQASLRGLVRAIDLAMMVAGAATSVDPGKIWEAAKSGFESGTKLKDYT